MSNDPTVRGPPSQQSQMNSFSFAPNQYPPQQRETQKSKDTYEAVPFCNRIGLT